MENIDSLGDSYKVSINISCTDLAVNVKGSSRKKYYNTAYKGSITHMCEYAQLNKRRYSKASRRGDALGFV